jgi:hypothetical protein
MGSWVLLAESLAYDIAVIGLQFQSTYIPASLDTTYEHLFEIGVGPANLEVVKIQLPYSIRQDTVLQYYLTGGVMLPEGFSIEKGSRVSVRVANSVATAVTYDAVKLRYQATGVVLSRTSLPNNYKFPRSAGLSVTEKIR